MTDGPITIRVGVPHPHLSPNFKARHWAVKGTKRKAQRHDARWCCVETMARVWPRHDAPKWTAARIDVRGYIARKRGNGWDRDNFVGALKGAVDGFKDAGLLLDDNGVQWGTVDIVYGESDPRVELVVTRIDVTGT